MSQEHTHLVKWAVATLLVVAALIIDALRRRDMRDLLKDLRKARGALLMAEARYEELREAVESIGGENIRMQEQIKGSRTELDARKLLAESMAVPQDTLPPTLRSYPPKIQHSEQCKSANRFCDGFDCTGKGCV